MSDPIHLAPGAQGRRRLLVISYHFPPDGAVGGLRWAGLAKYLARMGWEVHVVTAAEQARRDAVEGVQVHTCRRRRTLNDVYNAWAGRRRAGAPPRPGGAEKSTAPPRPDGVMATVRGEIGALMVFPDAGRGWILRAARTARSLLRRMPFDAVVTSGPPHSAHLAGVLATLGRPEPLCVDMRDPWAGVLEKQWGRGLYGSFTGLLIPHLERLMLRRARRAIANTAEFADELQRAYPETPVAFVPNGIDPERLPAPAAVEDGELSLAYVGTLYAGRDLTPVLLALREFLSRHPEARARTSLHVAGSSGDDHSRRFREQLASLALEDVVQVRGLVPPAEALALLNGSRLALVLAQDQHMQVPAKLYECVGLHLPTLVIAERSSAAFREAGRVGAVACETHDVEGIARLLERLWRDEIPARPAPASAIDYAGLAVEMAAVIEECGAVARPAGASAPEVEQAAASAR